MKKTLYWKLCISVMKKCNIKSNLKWIKNVTDHRGDFFVLASCSDEAAELVVVAARGIRPRFGRSRGRNWFSGLSGFARLNRTCHSGRRLCPSVVCEKTNKNCWNNWRNKTKANNTYKSNFNKFRSSQKNNLELIFFWKLKLLYLCTI